MAIASDGNVYNIDYVAKTLASGLETTQGEVVVPEIVYSTLNMDINTIAAKISADRSEYREATIINVLKLANKVYRQFLGQGYSVDTGNFILKPTIKGSFDNPESVFDPTRNKKAVYALVKQELKDLLEQATLTPKGTKKDVAYITDARNMTTSDLTLDNNDVLILKGKNILVSNGNETADKAQFYNGVEWQNFNFDMSESSNLPTIIKNTPSEVRILYKNSTASEESRTEALLQVKTFGKHSDGTFNKTAYILKTPFEFDVQTAHTSS